MLRQLTAVALATATALAVSAAVATAQQTSPTAPTAPSEPTGPPALDSLRLPKIVSAQQGHARFLVGVRLSAPGKLSVQVVRVSDGKVMQTDQDVATRPAGRAYTMVEAVDDAGFQLLRGRYRLRVQATGDDGQVSRALETPFRLRLTAPRGLFDAYTIPTMRAYRRDAGTDTPGQLVAVVGPKGTAATAGIRRGDVITTVDGRSVATAGGWAVAMRALPAAKAVTVDFLRAGQPLSVQITPKPDWTEAPDHAASLEVAVRRAPASLAIAVAQARQRMDSGNLVEAGELIAAWRTSWRESAAGELAQADLLAKQEDWKKALGAYNRARKRDPTLAAAELGRGIALAELGGERPSLLAFSAAARLDATDPSALGFRSYALLQEDRVDEAVAAGQAAVGLDRRYADAYLPLGIALIADGDKPNGVKALRRGLVLLEEPDRAGRLIRQHLQRADP